MDSTASISTFGARLMPFLAILRYDLRTLTSSWLVRLWLAGSILLTLLLVAGCWAQPHLRTAEFIGILLFPYLVGPWFLVVVVLGADPVSAARTDALADGILSRPITRSEYLLASWAARLSVVVGSYLVVIVPAVLSVALAQRKAPPDTVTTYGIIASLAVVALVLTFLVSLAYLLGTLFRRPLLAIVVALFIWFPSNLILNVFALDAFSTFSLNKSLPLLLRTPWRVPDKSAEPEKGFGSDIWSNPMESLLGLAIPKPPPDPKGFFDRDRDAGFSLLRVILGYGLSTLVCVGLTLFCFCNRDL